MISGWLSPSGEFFIAQNYEHIFVAQKIVEENYYPAFLSSMTKRRTSEDQFLVDSGWAHLTGPYFFFDSINFKFTNAQIKFINTLMDEFNFGQKTMISQALEIQGRI